MCQITAQSPGRISLFFTIRGINCIPRMVSTGRRRRPIFLADSHLGQDARLTSVGIEERTPREYGMRFDDFARRYLAQCPKRPTQAETPLQSARSSRSTDCFRATHFGNLSFLQGASWDNVFFRCHSRHNVIGALL
jgi:hypothetical protein